MPYHLIIKWLKNSFVFSNSNGLIDPIQQIFAMLPFINFILLQVPDWEKEAVPEHVKKAAREMAQKAFKER